MSCNHQRLQLLASKTLRIINFLAVWLLQVLGANALLLRSLIDCVATAARCAGPVFSSGSSRLLRTSVLPLLERLADACHLVSTAAAGALDSICRHTGYPMGLSQLVGANADYVVDGVCRQLRSLQQHPRAPQLLAALLREAGVSAALMPLLAEPLRAALSVSRVATVGDSRWAPAVSYRPQFEIILCFQKCAHGKSTAWGVLDSRLGRH